MSFLFCFPLYTYLFFVWFSVPFWLPSYMEESYGIFKNPSPSSDLSVSFTYRTSSFCYHPFFFIRTLKTAENYWKVNSYSLLPGNDHEPPSWNMTCYLLGHHCAFELINLKHWILIWTLCSKTLLTFHFPEAMQHNLVLKFHTRPLE